MPPLSNRIRRNVVRDVDCSLKHVLVEGRHMLKPWHFAPNLTPAAGPPNGFSASPPAWVVIVSQTVERLRLFGYPITLEDMPESLARRLVTLPVSETTAKLRGAIRKKLEQLPSSEI